MGEIKVIPDIHTIVEMLIAHECTAQQALAWISSHFQNSELRDAFAMAAMQGELACQTESWRVIDEEKLAAGSYKIADAMIAVRNG